MLRNRTTPSANSSSSAEAPASGERSNPSAIWNSRCFAFSAAARIAEPTLAALCEPPDTGAFGKSLSPSSKRTRCSGIFSASAASCAITV